MDVKKINDKIRKLYVKCEEICHASARCSSKYCPLYDDVYKTCTKPDFGSFAFTPEDELNYLQQILDKKV